MKSKSQLFGILAMAAMMDLQHNHSQGTTKRKELKYPEEKRKIDFNKQEGVLNMIADYNLINEGKSKKGKLKQQRIINKINEWLENGLLTNEDLKN